MQPLLSAIAQGTVQIWAAALVMAAASLPILRPRAEFRHVEFDRHTLQDIGIAPGSITWL